MKLFKPKMKSQKYLIAIFLITIGCFFRVQDVSAQNIALEWAINHVDSSIQGGYIETTDICVDQITNEVYTAGYFQNTADFISGPGSAYLTAVDDFDSFVVKHDSSGNYMWAFAIGGGDIDFITDIAIDCTATQVFDVT
ncbi:MAG: hypothetical protein QNK23_15460 [Crocinitomicaceae bacterium]|nr:hypothetical protein [Crocinitomicaceae bacterium]